ncbi:MAG: cytochrome P460 family protein [Ignavibacterium album]|uniref:cytochrome P460 family protein n=1 Tax=Ignavibacterium album TaxID=591197 RepID=UPI0026EB4E55|nr:cytochrome P460 family protein [Ignavibacterium album]MBI5662202.1 cytochrome P460 family protein [Ignavibacterium album]
MKKQNLILVVSLFLVALSAFIVTGSNKNEVAYPDGYRNWTHVKTLILEKGHPLYEAFGGIHHIYANKKALDGYKAGNRFGDGSVIVFDLLETVAADNAISEGKRKVVGVMEKNSKKFKDTGGWGFEGFKGDSRERVVKNMDGECFSCHLSQKDRDYVFSEYRK